MQIKQYPMQGKEGATTRIEGTVTLPQGSKIIHVGATPPNGEMFVFAEVSPVKVPDQVLDIAVLQVDQTIPNGYKYLGYILAIPILFIYSREPTAIIT